MNQTFTKYATMRRLLHVFLFILLTIVLFLTDAKGQAVPDGALGSQRIWTGSSSTDWSDASNWVNGNGASASVPGPSNTVIFDASATNDCIIDPSTVSIRALKLKDDFAWTVIQAENTTINISTGAIFGGGYFVGASDGVLNVSGGNFTVEASGDAFFPSTTLNIGATAWILSGSFTMSSETTTFRGNVNMNTSASIMPNGGTMVLAGATNRTFTINGSSPGSLVFDNVEINTATNGTAWTIPAGDVINVAGTLDLTNGRLIGGGGMAATSQVVNVNNGFDGLETTLTLNGDDPVNLKMNAPITTQSQGVLVINKTSPSTVVEITKDLPGAIVVMGNANGTIRVTSGTVTHPNNFPVILDNSLLDIQANGTYIATSDETTLTGSFTNAGTFNANGGSWVFSGPVNANYNASVATVFNDLTIAKTGAPARVTLQTGAATVSGLFSVTSGNVLGPGAVNAQGDVVYSSTAASTAVLNFTGSAPQTVTFTGATSNWNGPVSFNQSTAGTITLASPWDLDAGATQTTTFTSGIVISDATNILSFGQNNTVTGGSASSFVSGPVRKTGTNAFTFPIGKGTIYAPAHISGGAFATALGTTSSYDAEYFPANPQPTYGTSFNAPLLNVSTAEYWNITKSSGADAFTWVSYEDARSGGAAQPSTLRIANNISSVWNEAGNVLGTGNNANFVGSTSAQTSYPAFTLASLNPVLNPLPVTWLNFTGRYNNGTIDLNWTTSMEKDNDIFTIERSETGHQFTTLGIVNGKGNASINNYYLFQDNSPVEGDNYYRIKQTDFDGKSTYSKTIRVTAANTASAGLKLYPNPIVIGQQLTLENATLRNKKVAVAIISVTGSVVRQDQAVFGSDSRYRLQISNLTRGSYFLRIQDGDRKFITPFIVQ